MSVTKKSDKNVIMGYAFIVFFFSIGVDIIDHSLLWVFGVEIGYWFPNILFEGVSCEGRNLHTIYIFALYSAVLSIILCAFVFGHKQPYSSYEVRWLNDEGNKNGQKDVRRSSENTFWATLEA